MEELEIRLSHPLLKHIISLLPPGVPVHLVGGAVRDALLDRQRYDLDFVTPGDALIIGRKLADDLGAAYFPLDPVRKVARLVLKPEKIFSSNGINAIRVDFSTYQGPDLICDLRGRDFTINAMAVDIYNMHNLVDPTGGGKDLLAKRLRACSPGSLIDDPVRILRAVRFSVDLDLNIVPDTLSLIREAVIHLPQVSPERLRDELFRILMIAHPSTSIRLLDMVNALEYILPEVHELKEIKQSPPHTMDVWDHSLDTLNRLESLLDVLKLEYEPDKASSLVLGLAALRLGRYREHLAEHLSNALNPDRPHRGLLFLAALYHDVGKPVSRSVDEGARIRFIGHEQAGSKVIEQRGQALRLSNLEVNRLVTIVNHHMRPSLLSHPEVPPSKKAIYHFFRDTGMAGVDICLISLADVLATYGSTLPQDRWDRHLDVVRALLEAWWEGRAARVFPPPVVRGEELMSALGLSPGPLVGYLLEAIREAQVCGEVHDRREALELAEKILRENINQKRAD